MIEILSAAYIGSTERDFFSFPDPHPHSSLATHWSIRHPHRRARVAAAMFNAVIDGYTQSILIFTGINIVAAYSFFAPFKTGQVSIGQAGFMAVGAYASAVLTQKFSGAPFIIAVPVAGLIAGVVGVVIGFPALRIKGIYLLLLTLGFSEIIQVIVLSWDYVGGAQGYRNIPFNRRTLESVIAVVALLIFFFSRLERSSLGRAMDSIHQDETASEVMGIDVVQIKLFAFGIGATIAGIAGALYAHQLTYIDSTTFNIMMSVEILTFVVVGGASTYWGPVVGAVMLSLGRNSCAPCANGSNCCRRRGRISIRWTRSTISFTTSLISRTPNG